jgi:hypothetical protein
MSKPETLNDIIKDTMRVSGVPYKVSVDAVNSPPHYTKGGIETIDYMEAKSTTEEFRGHLRLTALKYLSRAGYKDDTVKDLKKAQWYINKLVSTYGEQNENFVL